MRKIVLLLLNLNLIVPLSFSQYPPPPDNGKIQLNYKIKELIVNDSIFLNKLDSFIFQKECQSVVNSQDGSFLVQIKNKDKFCLTYSFLVYFSGVFSIQESALGYFVYKGYTFFIYGTNLQGIFCETEKYKSFKIERNKIPIIEEYPMWEITYENGEYNLEFFDCW